MKPTLVVSLLASGLTTAHAGFFDNILKDIGTVKGVGKSIDKSMQDVGKSVGEIGMDVGKTFPEIEHSPPDPCANNAKLPQCELGKIEPSR